MLQDLKFTQERLAGKRISDLPDRPSEAGMTAAQLKAAFDRLGEGEIALGRFNELIDALMNQSAAAGIGADKTDAADDSGGNVQSKLARLAKALTAAGTGAQPISPGDKSAADVQSKLAYLFQRIQEIVAGEGLVASVNGLLPDELGDVRLTEQDIGDLSATLDQLTASAAKLITSTKELGGYTLAADAWTETGETYTQEIAETRVDSSYLADVYVDVKAYKDAGKLSFPAVTVSNGALAFHADKRPEKDIFIEKVRLWKEVTP